MKKFIEVLKEKGIMDRMIDSVKKTNKVTGKDNASFSSISLIFKLEMLKDEELFNMFIDEATEYLFKHVTEYVNAQVQESEKTEALMKQGAEFLEQAHASMNCEDDSKGVHGLKKENEEALEDALVHGFVDFLNSIAEMIK